MSGNVTEIVNGGRIVSGQKLTAADLPYSKGNGNPFTLFVAPIVSGNTDEYTVCKGVYYQEETAEEIPLNICAWNSILLKSLPADALNATLFTNYVVYVGAGYILPS